MCGIFGFVSSTKETDPQSLSAQSVLVKGLKRLEYRGYDSAGIAVFQGATIEVRKAEGKLQNVEKILAAATELKKSGCGIGHTRWATHGKPTTQNAHPHRVDDVVLVHNGIIENFMDLKKEIQARGITPKSETDSELFGYLVIDAFNSGEKSLAAAVRTAFKRVRGACSVVVMSEREPGVVVGVRSGSPLVAAYDPKRGAFLASDAQPILDYTNQVYFLDNGDLIEARAGGITFSTLASDKAVSKKSETLDWSPDKLEKGGYAHFMLKEIHEQPTALVDTINALFDRSDAWWLADQPGIDKLLQARELILVACGTSWHAALVGKYWIERIARVPVQVEWASEFRYRNPVIKDGALIVGITQSGETADTLAVLRDVKQAGHPTVAITNVRGSTVCREADAVFFTSCGPEIGVAATKTFISQLAILLTFAGVMAKKRGSLNEVDSTRLYDSFLKLPHFIKEILDGELSVQIKRIANEIAPLSGFFFMGRGLSFPIALEGALKLKEIAYVHAEGYAAGELKHGPIAMLDKKMCVIVLAPRDPWHEKTVSNLQEVKARGAYILGVGESTDEGLRSLCDVWIGLPARSRDELDEALLPFLLVPVVQLLSYELALIKGTDVDKPRNLAKSVTVE